jgi:AAA domain
MTINPITPTLPAWLLTIIQRPQVHEPRDKSPSAGKREESYAAKALDNLAHDLAAMAPETGRNERLNIAALKLGTMVSTGWIGEATVSGRLFDACVANALVRDTGAKAVNATIQSGLKAGLAQPHAALPNREWNEAPSERETQDSSARQRATTWRDGMITAAELQSKQFKPVRIVLPELIPEGVTLVAGKPKVGKSWLALDVCLAVADETRFVLGDKRPVHGDALYLALEDNERRLKKRIDKVLQDATASKRLQFHTEWRRMDHGGLEDIEAWIKSVPEPRLIWIDTLAKVRPLAGRNEQAYAADYRAIEGVQKLAGQYGLAIVLNTHLRKAPSEDDPFDEVNGTLGQTGAADTIIVMKRHSGMMKIYVRGRDIEEAEFAAEFNRNTCRWRLVGEADEVFRSQQRQAIATALKEAGRPMSVSEIMAATERRDRHATEVILARMEKAGEVKHVSRGQWAHPNLGGHPTESGVFSVFGEKAMEDGKQVIDKDEQNGVAKTHRETHCKHTAGETSVFASVFSEPANPLFLKGSAREPHKHTDHTGSDYTDAPDCLRRIPNSGNGFRPPRGDGWQLAGDLPPEQAGAIVFIQEIQVPAISAGADDDVLDIDRRWRQ